MKTISLSVRERTECRIVCRKNAFGALAGAVGDRQAFVFTDGNVLSLYGRALSRALSSAPVFAMEPGEKNKTPQTLFALLGKMAEAGLKRGSVLVALGGGVVGDVGGLAASLYMRGISYIQVPTTLLAQVDSSVGGKTAVDLLGTKNLVGAFHMPELVLADGAFFRTLPPRELRCGLGEIVKHGALSVPIFAKLSAAPDLFNCNFLAGIVPENIAFKADVVRRDPHEKGLRKCLNLGHTTAHAVELSSGLSHGECVLWGLIAEGRIAARHLQTDGGFLKELEAVCLRVLGGGAFPTVRDARAALLDKKNTAADTVTLTVPVAAGIYRLLELPFARYEEELGAIGRELC